MGLRSDERDEGLTGEARLVEGAVLIGIEHRAALADTAAGAARDAREGFEIDDQRISWRVDGGDGVGPDGLGDGA